MTAIELHNVTVAYPVRRGVPVKAVEDISLRVPAGGSFGIVGESGCGKTTTAKVITGLVAPTSGTLTVGGTPVPPKRSADLRRRVQMVFQDPASSLNPRRTVRAVLSELLLFHRLVRRTGVDRRLAHLMDLVALPTDVLDARPGDLSGGQRQRAAIARAIAVEPSVLIADEAVSALDVSAQARVINLLADLREELGLTLIFISHDLAVVRAACDEVAVMRSGAIVETGRVDDVFETPREDYTRRLLAAAPSFGLGGSSAPGQDA